MRENFPSPQPETGSQPESEIPKARFDLGKIWITPEAQFSLHVVDRTSHQLVTRHVEGDWGDIDEHDKMENEQSADQGGIIFSAYNIEDARFYVRTDPTEEGNVTTIYLPYED